MTDGTNPIRRGWAGLIALMAGYLLIFGIFYPPLSAIEDEVGFVNQAMAWSRGSLTSEGAGFAEVTDFGMPGVAPHLVDFVRVGDRHVSGRHPGRSAILLPFVGFGGVRAGFASGALIHLATTAVGAVLLARLGRSPAWAAAILFHPTLALYSRTIMGDEAAGGLLLLATLSAIAPGRRAAIAAGVAVGLAATMRYHAGLALPIVAAAIGTDPGRPRRRLDGVACLVAGGAVGLLIVAYNLALYRSPLDPVGSPRGQFGVSFLAENGPFYAVALMILWPGMLVAPAFDRTPVGRVARPLVAAFALFFSAYYFHDRAGGRAETLVVGLRLMQVALPVWIVSYVAVIDGWARPIGRWGRGGALGVVAIILLGLTSVAFAKHQNYLIDLARSRAAMVAAIPDGSVVVEHGAVHKLFAIPTGGPVYRWRMLDFQGVVNDHSRELDGLRSPWYVAILARGERPPGDALAAMTGRYHLIRVRPDLPGLILYRAPGAAP